MGWKGGGLGVDAQGISEPIKPNLQMVSINQIDYLNSKGMIRSRVNIHS